MAFCLSLEKSGIQFKKHFAGAQFAVIISISRMYSITTGYNGLKLSNALVKIMYGANENRHGR